MNGVNSEQRKSKNGVSYLEGRRHQVTETTIQSKINRGANTRAPAPINVSKGKRTGKSENKKIE